MWIQELGRLICAVLLVTLEVPASSASVFGRWFILIASFVCVEYIILASNAEYQVGFAEI